MCFAKFLRVNNKTSPRNLDSDSGEDSTFTHIPQTRSALMSSLLWCSLAFAVSTPALAMQPQDDNRSYYGVGIGTVSVNNLHLNTYDVQAGYEVSPWMGLEAHLGASSSDDHSESGYYYKAKLEYYNSIRVRLNMVARDYRAYAFFGFTTTKFDVNDNVFGGYSPKYAGYAYGIGIDLFGNESTALYASAGRLLDHDIDDTGIQLKQYMVGFRYYLRSNYNRSRIPDRLKF